nr:uncharacterized protein LOC118879664 [Drosophila suzukii]
MTIRWTMYILVFVFFLRNYFAGFQPGRVPPAFGLPSRPFSAQSGHFREITPSLPHRKQNLLHSVASQSWNPCSAAGVRRVAASHGCSHPRSLPAVAHVEEARASFRVPSGGHGTDPSEPCAAGPKCPLWTGVHVPSTTPSLCSIRERGSCAELHSTDVDAAAAGAPDGTRSRPRNGHRPRRRMRGSSGPLGCSGFRCRLPRWRITAARPENPPSFGPRCAMVLRFLAQAAVDPWRVIYRQSRSLPGRQFRWPSVASSCILPLLNPRWAICAAFWTRRGGHHRHLATRALLKRLRLALGWPQDVVQQLHHVDESVLDFFPQRLAHS